MHVENYANYETIFVLFVCSVANFRANCTYDNVNCANKNLCMRYEGLERKRKLAIE